MSLSSEQRTTAENQALRELAAFPLLEALYGRRSRRFALGAEIPDGPLAYRSRHEPLPLTELERMLMLSAVRGSVDSDSTIALGLRALRPLLSPFGLSIVSSDIARESRRSGVSSLQVIAEDPRSERGRDDALF